MFLVNLRHLWMNKYRNKFLLGLFSSGVEPSKPRALWDGRFANEFCNTSLLLWKMLPKLQKLPGKGFTFLS